MPDARHLTRLILLLAALLTLHGCSTSGGKKEGAEEAGPGPATEGAEVTPGTAAGVAMPLGDEARIDLEYLDDPASPLSQRVVYFDFDSDVVPPEWRDVVAAHGKLLAKYPDLHVRLEGHTDERGSREYNLGLGERRARAVAERMRLEGAQQTQMSIVSFGEEKPADPGHDETAWAKNRRVEIVYER